MRRQTTKIDKILLLLAAFILASCGASVENRSIDENKPTLEKALEQGDYTFIDKNDTASIKKAMAVSKPGFDTLKFRNMVDSFFTEIQGKQSPISIQRDSVTPGNTAKGNWRYVLRPSSTTDITVFFFNPGKGSAFGLDFSLTEAKYQNERTAQDIFKDLRKASGHDPDDYNDAPGLSYQNDYAFLTGKTIYWLNSGCPFTHTNHKKIKTFLWKSITPLAIKDSINCRCGDVICK